MKGKPLAITIWFIGCVSLGLYFAAIDGVDGESILIVALIMSAIALTVAFVTWLIEKRGKR